MRTKKNKTPLNKKGQPHGFWEKYYDNGQLFSKGNFVNGKADGYWETYFYTGKLLCKGKFVKNNRVGLWLEYDKKVFYGQ